MKKIVFAFLFSIVLMANERIVSLSPSITEIVFALGKGKSLVATSSFSLYPKEAQKLPIIGGYEHPRLEKILSFRPTIVIGQHFNATTLEKLKKFHIKTLSLKLQSIKDIKHSIKLTAKTIHSNKADKLIDDIDKAIKEIKPSKPHSVLIVYGLREDLRSGIYVAGHDIFFEDIIKLCGCSNAFTSKTTSQPRLNYENIIALNPDQIIIIHSHKTNPYVDVKKALKSWYNLPTNASKHKNISIVDEDYIYIPSQRVALSIKRLSKEMSLYHD